MNSKKILVIDDNKAILESLSLMLDFEGFDVEAKEDAKDFFEKYKDEKPDLIMLDIMLQGEDGRDICREIKLQEHFKNIPIVMMSAGKNMEESALESGADVFIPKPFDFDVMIEKVKQLITP